MKTETTPGVKTTDWTEDEIKVIAMYQEKLGMTRSNAIRKMRTDKRTPAQQLAEGPVARKAAKDLALDKPLRGMVKEAKAAQKTKKSTEPKQPAFSTKPAGKGDAYTVEGRGGKYDKQLVVNLFMDGGKTPSEIAALGSAGLKGISPVYCHRILFGNEESGGINKGQAARRSEQAARVKAWAAEKAKKG
jgi:hypothetical protein